MNVRWLAPGSCCLPGIGAARKDTPGSAREAADYAEVTRTRGAGVSARPRRRIPDFRIEWWYLTANLDGADGEEYGAQWTLLPPAPSAPGRSGRAGTATRSGWATRRVTTGRRPPLRRDLRPRRRSAGRGRRPRPFRAWIDDWEMSGRDGRRARRHRRARRGRRFRLRARGASGPAARCSRARTATASSRRRARRPTTTASRSTPWRARSTVDGRTVAVTGQAWLDREWSSQPMRAEQEGWDWFALHLKDGAKVMLYRFRVDGRRAPSWPAPGFGADGRPDAASRPARPAGDAGAGGGGGRAAAAGGLADRDPVARLRGGHAAPERAKLGSGTDFRLLGGADPVRGHAIPAAATWR